MKKIKLPKWLKYILYPVGLYAAWFIIGIILVETKIVNEFPVGFGVVIADGHKNTDFSVADIDGPHIFYTNDTIIVSQIIRQDTQLIARIDTFHKKEDINELHVQLPDSALNFTTTLKQSIENEKCLYDNVQGILAISDIEGNFQAFRKILIANKVIDNNYNWIFGDKHLVLVGDFFDRGLNVTECLWLIYHLEQKAIKSGGYVHFILGNHEIMNMSDNLKYVRNKYIENTYIINKNYKKWYKSNTELGKWLQSKNIIEKIGDILFVHGGISEEVLRLNLQIEEINTFARPYYFTADTARQSGSNKLKLIFDTKFSPFWYRDYVKEKVKEQLIDNVITRYNVKKIVVGHTIVPHVSGFYNNKVIGIDTKHSEGINEGIYIEGGKIYRVDLTGQKIQL